MKGKNMTHMPNHYIVAKITKDTLQEITRENNGVEPKIEEFTTYFIYGDPDDIPEIISEEEFTKNFEYMYASDRESTFRSARRKI